MSNVFTLLKPTTDNGNHNTGKITYWDNLHGSALALAIAEFSQNHSGLSLVICADNHQAAQLERELSFFAPDTNRLTLPDWETLPYDNLSPHQDILSERIGTLYQLPEVNQGILVVSITTLMHRLAPASFIRAGSLAITPGDKFDIERRRHELDNAGYRAVDTVYEHGEYAVRGALVDLYPMGAKTPYRIDLFDDEVETIRSFDPETQRSIEKIAQLKLLPAREYPLDKAGISNFKMRWHEQFDVDHKACPMYRDLSDGIAPAGIEYYLPLFFEHCDTLFDYLPNNCHIITCGQLEAAAERFWHESNNRYQSRCGDIQRPVLPPRALFTPIDELFGLLKRYPRIAATTTASGKNLSCDFATSAPPMLPADPHGEQPLGALQCFLLEEQNQHCRHLFCAESAGRRETLIEMLAKIHIKPTLVDSWQDFLQGDSRYSIAIAPLDNGLSVYGDTAVNLIAETQLFGDRVQQRRRRTSKSDNSELVIKHLTELQIGAAVVHIDHGVGRYQGLVKLDAGGEDSEFLMLSYADDAKLYVPVTNLHLISRYSGADDELAPLHKLGSEQWSRAKRRAAEKVRDTAAELLDIYARRDAAKGLAFDDPKDAYEAFAAGFPFEETPDQYQAIEAVRRDMLSDKTMDRLVCGDVGFGKTEVAMRAAFIATYSGKQVAILAPTTLLAQQHYQSFKDRFADWPVNIEVMSRFKTAKEISAIENQVAEGKIDILVGTHKLLQDNLKYRDLGLLIIDEEHRFGVKQKDKLKSLRSQVDILTLTATPIPRTLNMSMSGIRDLSIIATAPAKRLSVKTFVQERDDATIKEAILRELLRGGQVYVLHNEVKSIDKAARELQQLLPEARIGVGHGQMRERELEQVMSDFYHKRFNVLVCTTIIETGIDIPNANTILIERADKFGLAQLHQLRGRVGRSHHQAYAYLLTPNRRSMTSDAIKRLEAIAGAQDLGAGFTLATHDMEIRGTGELLGDEQSGHIQTVGFTLFMDMLDRAVKSIRSGRELNLDKPLDTGIDINLRVPALIPDDYIPDVNTRLVLYKRIANCSNRDELRDLQIEMIDRFGLLPEATKNLIRVTELKFGAEQLGISKIEASSSDGRIEFTEAPSVDPMKIVQLVQTEPQKYQLEGASHLKFQQNMDNADRRISAVNDLLEQLNQAS